MEDENNLNQQFLLSHVVDAKLVNSIIHLILTP